MHIAFVKTQVSCIPKLTIASNIYKEIRNEYTLFSEVFMHLNFGAQRPSQCI